ncbi:MAG TPA: peptidyl-alpha-hydroxyglycine alpha-amidating lyase family protein [Rhizomicrobium sp.]|nr:peptidyl-alpha-hydroxyglycine alpha-amidating lyase family protein [Rhizomicrobium sp.]
MRLRHVVWVVCALAVSACAGGVPPVAMPPPHDPNDYPNPYHVEEGWAKLDRKFGDISAVDMDRDGKSVWVFERCGSNDDACAKNKTLNPVLKFDASGKLVKSWGAGEFLYPHGIFIGRDNHVWLAEGISPSGVVANVLREFTQDGKLLRTMGTRGASGATNELFNGLSDVLVAPDGSIFVADGHNDKTGRSDKTNNRILKYDRNGKFLLSWGKLGSGPGEFSTPHGLAMDRQGRLYVADRSNNRIQIFDQQGKFLAEWRQFGRPSGIFIKGDMLYVSDSHSNPTTNPGFKNGIRWGKISDGKVLGFIPWGEYNTIESVTVDDAGNIYAGFTNVPNFRKFVKN